MTRPRCPKCSTELFTVRYKGDRVECFKCGKMSKYDDLFPETVEVDRFDKINAIELAGFRNVAQMYSKLNEEDKDIIYDLMVNMLGEKKEHN